MFAGRGNLKHPVILFVAVILFYGVHWAAAQGVDVADQGAGEPDGLASPGAEGAGGTGTEREAERAYLWGEGAAAPESAGGVSSVWVVFRTVIVLALAAAAIYGIVYFLKRGRTGELPDDTYLKVLARTPINIKTAAAVIAVGGRAWLVGLSDANVSLISEITDTETVDAMLLAYSERAAGSNNAANFTSLLRRFAGGGRTREAAGTAAEGPADISVDTSQPLNLQRNRERLKNL
ncbi:MAG: flagellar biosynthetic protein FliO [Spirochaetaceae bacterium]|jgi:flagellar protein FliO/FliZ|nr:flagellar biosynthetic protein FliO [Spirochaetaceae bacterium]